MSIWFIIIVSLLLSMGSIADFGISFFMPNEFKGKFEFKTKGEEINLIMRGFATGLVSGAIIYVYFFAAAKYGINLDSLVIQDLLLLFGLTLTVSEFINSIIKLFMHRKFKK